MNFDGVFYKAKGAVLEPKPVQKPYPKLLFGSTGSRMLSLAGTFGDIIYIPPWRSGGQSDVEEAKKTVLKAAEKANRADKVSFMGGSMMGMPITDMAEFSKGVEAAIEEGARYYLVSLPRGEDSSLFLEKFSEEVIQSFK